MRSGILNIAGARSGAWLMPRDGRCGTIRGKRGCDSTWTPTVSRRAVRPDASTEVLAATPLGAPTVRLTTKPRVAPTGRSAPFAGLWSRSEGSWSDSERCSSRTCASEQERARTTSTPTSHRIRRSNDVRHPDYAEALTTGNHLVQALRGLAEALNEVNVPEELAGRYQRGRLEAEVKRLGRSARDAARDRRPGPVGGGS